MKKGWLGVGVLVVGLVSLLGILAYALDHLRATSRVVPGLGESAEPSREEALAVPEGEEDRDIESTRQEVPRTPREPSGLVVRVLDEKGERVSWVDVLAYRGDELVRAGVGISGTANLIQFDGPGNLRVERNSYELARLAISEGRGQYEIVVPHLASVAGIVLVDGVPREGIRLQLESGGGDDWLGRWIAHGLETAGLQERSSVHVKGTEADGSFRYASLAPDWSGVLRVEDSDAYRIASGPQRLELAHPDEGLVLELAAQRPEVLFRGRVVFAGQPVSEAIWELSDSRSGHCDELGRFSIYAFADELQRGLRLELTHARHGPRRIELGRPGIPSDLGDVELPPLREVVYYARSESGAPIDGARARPRRGPVRGVIRAATPGTTDLDAFAALQRSSAPTDSTGRGVLSSLGPDESVFGVSARGYATTDAFAPEDLSEPITVVLPRSAAAQVVLRDRSGRVPRGVRVRLEARGPPFTWADGNDPRGDELTLENLFGGGNGERGDDAYSGEFFPHTHGRAWIDALRAGVPFEVSAVDEYGSVLASARELVLGPGEWRRIELRVQARPRTLLVVVRDSLGHPLSGANLKVWPPGATEPRWSKLNTDRAGMVRTEPLYSDDVALRVSRLGFESHTLEHVRVPPEGATVELRLAHDWWSW